MRYAKRVVWVRPDRKVCTLLEDGSVRWEEGVTEEEYRYVVRALLCEAERKRQESIERAARRGYV
jgi:hypothetical protein